MTTKSNQMRFRGKSVLVTGADRNSGLGIAAAFAAEGATVFLNGRTPELVTEAVGKLKRRGYKKVVGAAGDVGASADVESIMRQIAARTKRLDVLVNNAAHLGVGHTLEETSREYFEAVLRVNLVGAFFLSQQCVRLMPTTGGAIVNIGTNVSTRAIQNRCAYLASKGGMDALTLAMAVELGPRNIRVNIVAPGYIHTDRWDKLAKAQTLRRRANVPLGREATADDVAQVVLFLASGQAANITGVRLVVDGGCSAQHLPRDIDV
jgi:NAD(P)-dependent dehydrogenase (short-subunit alcohol dehydrogenase family)